MQSDMNVLILKNRINNSLEADAEGIDYWRGYVDAMIQNLNISKESYSDVEKFLSEKKEKVKDERKNRVRKKM